MYKPVVWLLVASVPAVASEADKSFGRSALVQQCAIPVVQRPADLHHGQPLAMGEFTLAGSSNFKSGSAEEGRALLFEQLKKHTAGKYFASVESFGTQSSGYLLEGEFLSLRQGSRAGRIVLGSEAGKPTLQFRARLFLLPDRTSPVAEVDCDSERVLKIGTTVIWNRAKSAKSVVTHEFEDAARSMTRQLDVAERLISHRAKFPNAQPLESKAEEKSSGGIVGTARNLGSAPVKLVPGVFRRKKTKNEPEPQAADRTELVENAEEAEELKEPEETDADQSKRSYWKTFRKPTLLVSNGRKGRRVEAVWLTREAYDAHLKLVAKSAAERSAKDDELRNGLVGAEGHLKTLAAKDVYVIAISFEKLMSHGPLIWETRQLQAKTTIRSMKSGAKAAPVMVTDPAVAGGVRHGTYYQARRVLFAFPVAPDGQPLIGSLDEPLELATEYDAAPVRLLFRPSDLGITDLAALKMR